MRSIVHPISGHSCTIKQLQVPLAPGFTITAHKVQGLMLPHVIIDLTGSMGTEPPYVMVSQCLSLDGLLIMRPFSISKITCHRSQEARNKFTRLNLSRWQSIMTHGTPQEQESVRAHLSLTEGGDHSMMVEQLFLDRGFEDLSQVGRLVQQLQDDNESMYGFALLCPPDALTSHIVDSLNPQASKSS